MAPLSPEISQQLLDSLPLGIYVVTLDRHILFWNKAAEKITGYRAQDVSGAACGDDVLVHSDARSIPVCSTPERLLACAVGAASPPAASLFARHKDGHHFAVQVRSIPLRDENGKVLAIAEIFEPQNEDALPKISQRAVASDPVEVLGIPSIADSEHYLESKLKLPGTLGVYVVEVVGIHEMARQRGLEMVHACERALVHQWGILLPMPHYLGHWHDRSFVIAMPNPTAAEFEDLLAQLSGPAAPVTIVWWGDRVMLSLRVRGAILHDLESLERLTHGERSMAQGETR
jgi:PAS domain S-box-containing protein